MKGEGGLLILTLIGEACFLTLIGETYFLILLMIQGGYSNPDEFRIPFSMEILILRHPYF